VPDSRRATRARFRGRSTRAAIPASRCTGMVCKAARWPIHRGGGVDELPLQQFGFHQSAERSVIGVSSLDLIVASSAGRTSSNTGLPSIVRAA
jgi:hypothetical protein